MSEKNCSFPLVSHCWCSTCLPLCSGCFGRHELYTCLPLSHYALGAPGRMISHFLFVSHLFTLVSLYSLGALGRRILHLAPTCSQQQEAFVFQSHRSTEWCRVPPPGMYAQGSGNHCNLVSQCLPVCSLLCVSLRLPPATLEPCLPFSPTLSPTVSYPTVLPNSQQQ